MEMPSTSGSIPMKISATIEVGSGAAKGKKAEQVEDRGRVRGGEILERAEPRGVAHSIVTKITL